MSDQPSSRESTGRRQMLQMSLWATAATSLHAVGCASHVCPEPEAPTSRCKEPAPCTCRGDEREGMLWGMNQKEQQRLTTGRGALPIVQRVPGGRNILRDRARELSSRDRQQRLSLLERRMRLTLVASGRGVGLAAPQVDVGVRAIVVMMGAKTKHPKVSFYVNPRIVERSDDITLDFEGCLSVPDVVGLVKRSKQIVVEYGLPGERTHSVLATGFDARIFQHEIDHLDGVLYIDRVEANTAPKDQLKRLRQQLRARHPKLACTPRWLGQYRDEILL